MLMNELRLQRLRRHLAEAGLDAVWVGKAQNRRYLSGFSGSAGLLLLTAETQRLRRLYTSFVYIRALQRRRLQKLFAAKAFAVSVLKASIVRWPLIRNFKRCCRWNAN